MIRPISPLPTKPLSLSANGQIEFIVPIGDGWSKPQESDRIDGYTVIEGARIEPAEFDNTDSVSVKIISLATGGTIKIHYGSYAFAANTAGGAKAPEQSDRKSLHHQD